MTGGPSLEQIAEKIAADLFVNGSGQRARRLVLMTHDGRDLGGWGERPMADRILLLLRQQIRERPLTLDDISHGFQER